MKNKRERRKERDKTMGLCDDKITFLKFFFYFFYNFFQLVYNTRFLNPTKLGLKLGGT